MTYQEKLREYTRELDNMPNEACRDLFNDSNWALLGDDKEIIFKAGIEHGLNSALNLAEEYNINKEI